MSIERFQCDERNSRRMRFVILDPDNVPVSVASLLTAELTLKDLNTGSVTGDSPAPGVINGRDHQDILNANNVTIDTEGVVIWEIQPDDNIIVTDRRQVERHMAKFLFTWAGGEFRKQVELDVVNLRLAA